LGFLGGVVGHWQRYRDWERVFDPEGFHAFAERVIVNTVRQVLHDWSLGMRMTAQAFLLTIALNGQATRTAAIIASALALVLSAVTLHLMLKHRWWQWLHRSVLSRMESDLGLEKITNLEDFYPRTDQDGTPREKTGKLHPKSYYLDPGWSVHHEPPGREPWIYRLRTFRIWIVGMTLVFIADLAILLMRISDSSLLTASTTTTNMP
jgi:hypothetical protein